LADGSPARNWLSVEAVVLVLTTLALQVRTYSAALRYKVGIAADIPARCPDPERRVLSVILSAYARRVMYLQSVVAGAARVDLDGKEAGKVTACSPRSWHRGRPGLWRPRAESGL